MQSFNNTKLPIMEDGGWREKILLFGGQLLRTGRKLFATMRSSAVPFAFTIKKNHKTAAAGALSVEEGGT